MVQSLNIQQCKRLILSFGTPETQRAREVRTFKQYAEFNLLLNNLETEVNTAYRKLLNDRQSPTPDLLRSSLNIFLQKNKAGFSLCWC
jgi:hypothetical protein